jgi:hypothetical protein
MPAFQLMKVTFALLARQEDLTVPYAIMWTAKA